MIELARKKRARNVFGFKGHVYAFDSTTIDLCLELFEWAKFRSTKGGVKVHTLLDVETKGNLADNILKDCKIALTGYKTMRLYGKPLRMVEYYDTEDK